MNRTAEFVLGLIGSILALLTSMLFVVLMAFVSSTGVAAMVSILAFLGVALSLTALVFSCLVNKNPKVSGIVLIITGILIALTNFLQILFSILILISGIMCLVRKPASDEVKT